MFITLQILDALFSYLNFLTEVGPQQWYFNEIRWIQSLKFHFFNEVDPGMNSARMATNLRCYGSTDCGVGSLLVTKWDPDAITFCLNMLSPSRANYIMLSQSLKNCMHEEYYYKTKYRVNGKTLY